MAARSPRAIARVGALVVLVGVFAAALFLSQRIATARAVDAIGRRAQSSAILLASSFRRELDKFGLVPVVLADDREARDALLTRDPARLAQLSRKLEALSDATSAANVYLLDARGVTVAASNWRRPDSFVGDNYAFRAYFRDALTRGSAHQFALGQRSRRPGLYISKRLTDGRRILGVFVVKVDFVALQREWRETGTTAFVADASGVILVSSNPAWQFQTTRPLSAAERSRARRSLDYGSAPLRQNRLYAAGLVAPLSTATGDDAFVEATESVGAGWRVHVLAATAPGVANALAFARLAIAIIALACGGLLLSWRHRRRGIAARIERETTQRLAAMREQLVQANKLATLGQITAGVAHEINQPLASIGLYAANARALIDRGERAEAVATIERVGALTERIGVITGELRGFARRASGEIGAVAIEEALAGTRLLLRDRMRMLDATFVVEGPMIAVRAERVRLEQVLVNLVQNALDAHARTIVVTIEPAGRRVRLTIADDGHGLTAQMRAALFQPFKTSKKDGLGLGLVICHDIVADFGGSLTALPTTAGAAFLIDLECAP